MSIDPGIKNFALGIENVCLETIEAVDDLSLKMECAQTVYFNNFALTDGTTREITSLLDSLEHLWSVCDVVLVERQVQFRGIINTKALRVAHHCLSYFEMRHPTATVVDYQASCKTRVLCAPRGMTKPQRKKWSTETAATVLRERGDTESLLKRAHLGCKLDDVSDCMLMCLAYAVTLTSRGRKRVRPKSST